MIVGVGPGLSASLARLFSKHGLQVAMAARNPDKLQKLAEETAGVTFACEATEPEEVAALFDVVIATQGVPDIVVYNASARARGPVTDLDPAEVARAISVSAYGGFLVVQQAARHMIARGSGVILLTGASASVKGYPNSSAFAMGKFALRGLASSMARELSPKGVHVAHFVIDGGIRSANRPDPNDNPDSFARPGRDRRDLLAGGEPAAQRMDVGGGIAAVGGEVLALSRWSVTEGCAQDTVIRIPSFRGQRVRVRGRFLSAVPGRDDRTAGRSRGKATAASATPLEPPPGRPDDTC